MSRYKLIKTYPFSPELGTIVDVESDDGDIKKYPEFWQKCEDLLENQVYQAIFDCVDIQGIDLELYKRNFQESNLFNILCQLFNYERTT